MTALVLELVEGPTLADRLERGPLSVPDALAIARQIVAALDAAHEKEIVHRDLKPANIVLMGEAAGDLRAKVLDFGLAKAIARDSAAVHPKATSSSFDGTADGRVLGTPAYMSPEQARGQTVDHRIDVWAFGCVLYEMLTGRPPFEGDTMSDTFVSILEREPDWVPLPASTPASVRRLLERCLRKDSRKRLHDIADAILDIDDAATVPPGASGGEAVASSSLPRRSFAFFEAKAGVRVTRLLPWVVASALAAALAWVALLYYRAAGPLPTEPAQLTIHPPGGVGVSLFALSPDGRYLAFAPQLTSKPMVWVHSLVTGETKAVPSTEGARAVFWKPDSQEIAFFTGDKLKTVAVHGGSPIAVASIDPLVDVGAWGRSNVIIVPKPGAGLQKVSATGGTLEAATVLTDEERIHTAPAFLPDGVHFLYVARPASAQQSELRVGSLESKEKFESLGPVESNVVYAAGYLFFVRGGFFGGGNLMARPFDPERRRLGGVPVPLGLSAAVYAPRRLGAFSVSAESGRLVYLPRVAPMFDLTWHNRGGQKIGTVGEPGVYQHLDLSPDDERVAVSLQTQQNGQPLQMDIWTIEVKPGGGASRVTEDPAYEADPAWSGDGRQLAFNSDRPRRGLFVRPSDGSGKDLRLVDPPVGGIASPDWSVDNKHIVYMDGGDLWVLPMTGDRKPAVFANTAATEKQPVFSADGRWVAYISDRSGRDEVYVPAFPRDETVHQVSREGGWTPRWRGDGKELFFLSPASKMMAVSIDPTKGTALGAPRELFPTDLRPEYQHRPYDVTRDGERFLVPTMRPGEDFRVVLNWRALLPK